MNQSNFARVDWQACQDASAIGEVPWMSSAQFHFTPKFVVDSTAAALLLQETYHKYPLMDLNSKICNSSKCKNRFSWRECVSGPPWQGHAPNPPQLVSTCKPRSCIEEPNQRVIRADWGCGNWERGLWRLLGKNLGGELLMSAYVLWRDSSTLCWPILAYKAGLALGLWTYEGWHGVLSASKRAGQDGGETGAGYGGVKKWIWFHIIPMTALLARLAQGRKGFWLSATRGHVDLLVPDAEDKVQAGPQWGQRKCQTEWDEDPALSPNGFCVEKRVRPRNDCLRGWCWILPSDFLHGTGWPSKAPRFPGINMNLLFRNESMNQHESTWINMNQYESPVSTCTALLSTSQNPLHFDGSKVLAPFLNLQRCWHETQRNGAERASFMSARVPQPGENDPPAKDDEVSSF